MHKNKPHLQKENLHHLLKMLHLLKFHLHKFYLYQNYYFQDKVPDIIDMEENVEMDVALNNYFKDLRQLVKKEKIIQRYSPEEFEAISNELENYILFKLYDKLFPANPTKEDNIFYKKNQNRAQKLASINVNA